MSAVGTISTVDPHQPHNATTSKLRFGPDFNPDYLVFILELGRGNGGVVSKTRHVPTGQQIVRKSFELDVKPAVRTQILRDLQVRYLIDIFLVVGFVRVYLRLVIESAPEISPYVVLSVEFSVGWEGFWYE